MWHSLQISTSGVRTGLTGAHTQLMCFIVLGDINLFQVTRYDSRLCLIVLLLMPWTRPRPPGSGCQVDPCFPHHIPHQSAYLCSVHTSLSTPQTWGMSCYTATVEQLSGSEFSFTYHRRYSFPACYHHLLLLSTSSVRTGLL